MEIAFYPYGKSPLLEWVYQIAQTVQHEWFFFVRIFFDNLMRKEKDGSW